MTVLLITISIPVFLQRVVESEDESEQEEVSGSEPDSRAQGDQNCNAAEPESDFEIPEDDENDVKMTSHMQQWRKALKVRAMERKIQKSMLMK